MRSSKTYNDIFVKKVADIVDLFSWTNVLEQGFPPLPTNSVVIDDKLVSTPIGLNNKAYRHHSTVGRKFGNVYFAHTVHDYDEDAGGKYMALNVSSDDGKTWSSLPDIMPQMSDMVSFGVNPSQWSYPSMFVDVPSGYYVLISCVSSSSYNPVGTAIRKINSDNTYGNVMWINNGISESSRIVPTPISGYPSYSFASEDLISEIRYFINQPKNKPKILFGWPEINIVQGTYLGDPLREPTTIVPYNYLEWLKVWRTTSYDYNVVQNGQDTGTQVLSQLPNGRITTAKRFYNYSPEIIVSVGHTKNTTRTELGVCIYRKNNGTGIYNCADGDAYSLTELSQNSPIFPGHEKFGGEQLPYINRVNKNLIDVVFSLSKESVYYKQLDISKLI